MDNQTLHNQNCQDLQESDDKDIKIKNLMKQNLS